MTAGDELIRGLETAGQSHVARHLRSLGGEARDRLMRQLSSFDWALVGRLAELARQGTAAMTIPEFAPAAVWPLSRPESERRAARQLGEDCIRAGVVAAFVAAGGQGSRLRFDGPKGCFPIGPVSRKSLFQILAEKVLASSRKYDAAIPFVIMTSETNDAPVRDFFRAHRFFGLEENDVFFCVQRMLPAFDRSGRLLLDEPGHVFVSPDGHGGSFFALKSSGLLDILIRRGIKYLSYFQVDNPLVPAIDPLFIGEHVRTGSEMSSKVLLKRDPLEKLAVLGRFDDGSVRAVEYSDMSNNLKQTLLPDGSLKYAFGSIAIHVIDTMFAARMASEDLPFHRAEKRIPFLDERGRTVEPDDPNGIKFERFIFDAIPLAWNPLVMEVLREDEFAPVKNFSGEDSPETARAAMMARDRRWLRAAGITVPDDCPVEISPLFALEADELSDKARDLRVTGPLYLA